MRWGRTMTDIPGLLYADCSFCGHKATFPDPVWLAGVTRVAICVACLDRAFTEIAPTAEEMRELSEEWRERRVVTKVFRGRTP